jgi:hypothetical protein
MATTTIFCPACNHKLRVPDDLMGQSVQCPKCDVMFTAPPPASTAEIPAPDDRERYREGVPEREPRPYEDDECRPRRRDWDDEELPRRSQGKLIAPAVIIMILSVLAFLDSMARVVIGLFFPKVVEQLQANNAQLFGQQPVNLDMRVVHVVSGSIFAILALLSFFGSIAMLRRQMYWLAIAGSVAAMLNITDCCCLIGLPVGIWALIILLQPDVKAGFN